jgi:two-component system, OmpR family, sensor kinase
MSLRARLALAVFLVAGVLVLSGIGLMALVRDSDIDELDHQLVAVSSAVATGLQHFEDSPVKLPVPRTIPVTPKSELWIGGVRPGDRVVTYMRPALNPDATPLVTFAEAGAHASTDGGAIHAFDAPSSVPGRSFRVASIPGTDGDYLMVALPTDRVNATFRRIVAGIVAAGTALLATLVLLTWWVRRLGLRPIAQITEAATAIAAGDLDRRVHVPKGRTEVGRLARAFNVMVDERQAWEEQLRRFVADASHELRTPLTTIAGVMELHRQGSLPAGAGLDDALRRADREARRMSALLEDLLLLARLDQGRPLANEPVDLGQVTSDVVFDARLTNPDRTIDVDVRPVPLVRGDESGLRQVVTNLVTNAVAHTDPDAEIHVTVRLDRAATAAVRGPACLVEVRDNGPGMTAEQARKVFDRFYRVDAGRTRVRGGSGLGLSIVNSIVAAHGGRVSVQTAPGQGAAFRVVLPLGRPYLQEISKSPRPVLEADPSVSQHGGGDAGDADPARPVRDRIPT